MHKYLVTVKIVKTWYETIEVTAGSDDEAELIAEARELEGLDDPIIDRYAHCDSQIDEDEELPIDDVATIDDILNTAVNPNQKSSKRSRSSRARRNRNRRKAAQEAQLIVNETEQPPVESKNGEMNLDETDEIKKDKIELLSKDNQDHEEISKKIIQADVEVIKQIEEPEKPNDEKPSPITIIAADISELAIESEQPIEKTRPKPRRSRKKPIVITEEPAEIKSITDKIIQEDSIKSDIIDKPAIDIPEETNVANQTTRKRRTRKYTKTIQTPVESENIPAIVEETEIKQDISEPQTTDNITSDETKPKRTRRKKPTTDLATNAPIIESPVIIEKIDDQSDSDIAEDKPKTTKKRSGRKPKATEIEETSKE